MDPFVAEIRMVGFNFAPKGWAQCQGQLLPISQNTALFSLLGTMYGGDGKSTFALPNLQGNTPIGQGQGPGLSPRDIGEQGGSPNVTLLQSEIPSHSHTLNAYTGDAGDVRTPTQSTALSVVSPGNLFSPTATGLNSMAPTAVGANGGNLPHNNMMPYIGLMYIIALQGVFPQRQ